MMKRHLRHGLVGALALTLMLGAAACAPSSPNDNEDPNGSGKPASTEMSILTGGEPRSMNCAAVVAYDQMVGLSISERLVPTDENFQPTKDGIVDEWERLSPTEWRLHAREGVEFSNGEAWNAEALKFSLETLRTTEGGVRAFFQPFSDVVVEDEQNVKLTTVEPLSAVPAILAFGCGFPPAYYQEVGGDEFGRAPIGTGPYVMEKWESGQQVTAVANENYWGGTPRLTKLTWKFVPDQSTRTNLLLSGGGDVALDIPIDRVGDVETAGLAAISMATGDQRNIQMNAESGQLESRALREAVAKAINRDLLVEAILGGEGIGAEATDKFFPPVFDTTVSSDFTYDPDGAKALVAAEGGAKITLTYTIGRYAKDQDVAEAVVGMLEAVGFEVERVPLDGSEFFAKKSNPGFDGLWIAAGAAVLPHPDVLVGAFLGTRPAKQYCADPEYDELGTAGLAAQSPEELTEVYSTMEDRVLNEDICFVPLYISKGVTATAEGVEIRRGIDTLIDYRTLGWESSK